MLYYSKEARKNAIENIDHLIKVIAEIPGDKLNYIEAGQIINHLCDLKRVIANEGKK